MNPWALLCGYIVVSGIAGAIVFSTMKKTIEDQTDHIEKLEDEIDGFQI